MEHAYHAVLDTLHCLACYKKMFPATEQVFFSDAKMISLTEEQMQVVKVVMAAYGSEKSITNVGRIRCVGRLFLHEHVPKAYILLTTCTRDAANDVQQKLSSCWAIVKNFSG